MTATKQYKIGDVVYLANGEMHGRGWDINADYRETQMQAQEDADEWFGSLSATEKRYAESYVRKYEVTAIDPDGSIGAVKTI